MRLNLNFKDAVITQLNQSEYRIVFDLSNMIKPRLSQDARLYIEHLNLPEFLDEAYGVKGNLRGYFELICENINNTDYDSLNGNSGSCVLYTSPLNNFATFTNNNPMFISNFKVNQGFLQDKLVFYLKVYDHYGNPYTTENTVMNELDETSSQYIAYKAKIKELLDLNTEKEDTEIEYKKLIPIVDDDASATSLAFNQFMNKKDNTIKTINAYIIDRRRSVIQKVLSEQLIILLDTPSINTYSYIFEVLVQKYSITPYKEFKAELKDLYSNWVNYNTKNFQFKQSTATRNYLFSSTSQIWTNFYTEFRPGYNVYQEVKTVPYTVTVLSGTPKTGNVSIECFTAIEQSEASISVYDIIPDPGTTNVLNKNDILKISATNFTPIIPSSFEYPIVKAVQAVPTNVVLSGTAAQITDKFFSSVVFRNASVYTVVFNDREPSKGFAVGDTIKVLGTQLGGATPANDCTITIDTIDVTDLEKIYTFPSYIDSAYNDKGPFDIAIKRDNAGPGELPYTIVSSNFTNTSNFSIGDKITINSDKLGGDSVQTVGGVLVIPPNDAELTVTSIIDKETFYINELDSVHSIPIIEINHTNSEVYDLSNIAYPPTAAGPGTPMKWIFRVYSETTIGAGEYKIIFDPVEDESTGFKVDDYIKIKGSVLTGVDGINDLDILITGVSTTGGKITARTIKPGNTYTPRGPTSSISLEIVKNVNTPDYSVDIGLPLTNCIVNDTFTILGSDIGGVNVTNDLKITVTTLEPDGNLGVDVVSGFSLTGLADFDTGNIGQIKTMGITGNGKFFPVIGKILGSTVTGTPIDITTITTLPDVFITLQEGPIKQGVNVVQSLVDTKVKEVETAKNALIPVTKTYLTNLGPKQLDKLKCMNLRLVLYDEIPQYIQASGDAITGNTYSRLNACQHKRI